MPMPNAQPTMPPEGTYSDIENLFIAEQPSGLFPENQNSNFGTLRKVLTNRVQVAADAAVSIFNELFIPTSVTRLSEWERELGLPDSAGAISDDFRRARLLSRRQRGPFTRARRDLVIAQYIQSTFGESVSFGSGGAILSAAGLPLYSGATSLVGAFYVVENVTGFSYQVRLSNAVGVDSAGLGRELTRITPAGISYSIVSVPDPFMIDAGTLTTNGQEITDAVRTTAADGDGRTPPDSSFGIWEGTTNIATNPSFETNITGLSNDSTATVVRDTSVAKFGAAGAAASAKVTPLVDSSYVYEAVAISGATLNRTFTGSAWVYATGSAVGKGIQLWLREAGGASAIAETHSATYILVAGWQRISVTRTLTANDRTGIQVFAITGTGYGVTPGILTGVSWWLDGFQIEEKTLATPFTTASRGNARVTVPASLFDATQGWLAMRVRPGWNSAAAAGGAPRFFIWQNAGTSQWIYAAWQTSTPDFIFIDRYNGSPSSNVAQQITPVSGVPVTVVFAWTATQLKVSANGAPFVTIANATIPSGLTSTVDIGSQVGGAPFNGDFLWVAGGKGTLTDADSAALFSRGNNDPLASDVSPAALMGFLARFNDTTYQVHA